MEFVDAASFSEIKNKGRKLINVKGQSIVLFFSKDKVYALNAVCPHRGGPLDEGDINDEEIVCPWHGFAFNLKTGGCLNSPGYSTKTYEVKIEGDKIKVKMD